MSRELIHGLGVSQDGAVIRCAGQRTRVRTSAVPRLLLYGEFGGDEVGCLLEIGQKEAQYIRIDRYRLHINIQPRLPRVKLRIELLVVFGVVCCGIVVPCFRGQE